ncbi:MAG: hypothetical protein WDM77_13495 [Steroidobacteraceae bacterium]
MGEVAQDAAAGSKDAVELVSVGRAIPYCKVRICADDDRELAEGTVGHILIGGDNVTKGYFEDATVNAATFSADGWLRTGDLGVIRQGELFITGRAKEYCSSTARTTTRTTWKAFAQAAAGLDLGKVVVAGVRPAGAQTDHIIVFVLHRGDIKDFLPIANEVAKLINEHTGLEVADVVPVKRIPKTTSGKIPSVHLLEESYISGEFTAELTELAALRASLRGPASPRARISKRRSATSATPRWKARSLICTITCLKSVASSLKLIEIHEQIDREFPGTDRPHRVVRLPTIAELAGHLEGKLKGQAG